MSAFSPQDAERYLLSLEMFGMRFGLDRMRRLMTALGHPQRRFDSIHVVGTNGKSSTTRMIAAILREHGVRSGSYLSPHLVSFCERIRIEDADCEPVAFAAAVQRAAHAAELVDRSLPAEDRVTQFEALTAAAYSELAERGVDVAVVEAGLGGRYDATNVIPSAVQVLTSVGLEHTRWLGPTISDIAGEKLDVVQEGGTLVLGAALDPDAEAVAVHVAADRGARIVRAPLDSGIAVGAPGAFQRRNFALALEASRAYLGDLDGRAVERAAADVRIPGRLQTIGRDPLTVVDAAHNPEGVAALVESLAEIGGGASPIVAVVSILEDKDAAEMLSALVEVCDGVIFTRASNPRALPPPTLESLWRQLGGPAGELAADPGFALQRARELASGDGMVLATGSIYLAAELLAPNRRRHVSTL
jgi:dihydrofolate synthase/folylpolyglutamate synthase